MSKKNFPTVIPLSVSSTGSISLQRSTTFNGIPVNAVFQYPQPDRYPCTVIDPSALRRWYSSFQYPQPDRYPCNLPRDQRQHRAVNFQYPQPDRYPCNRITRKPFDSSVLTFSILNRIDIPATTVHCWKSV